MKTRKQILQELDGAIDSMDMQAIDSGLKALPPGIIPEDAGLFAARILKLNEEKQNMKSIRKPAKLAIIAAAALLLGVTAYAAVTGSLFTFGRGDRYVTVRSSGEMTEQEALDMAEAAAEDQLTPERASEGGANAVMPEEQAFASVEEAEKGMDMIIPTPSTMPEMTLDSATGQTIVWGGGNETRSVWLTYSDEAGRLFGITVTRDITASGESTRYSESDMDEGSLGSYTSKTGVTYDTLTESDDTGERTAHIANAVAGEYQYALVFYGFEDAERFEIIDSVDLSAYN